MTLVEIHKRAQLNRDCGLPLDADMIDALADVVEAVQSEHMDALEVALARVEAIQL